MQTLTTPTTRPAANDLGAVLRRHGFSPAAGGWRRGDLAFRDARGWLVFTSPWPSTADPLHSLGAFGLWKPVRDEQQMRRMFAVRQSWMADDDFCPADEDRSSYDCLVDWASATAEGTLPSGWVVADRTSVDACLGKTRLTLVHRGFTRQLQILHAADRLTLRLPILPAVPANLPEARRRWLRTLLLDAQNTHQLFRLGFIQEGAQTSVIAEIDLTGVPSMLLEPLLSKSCDALRWVVAWLVESADFLAQADVASRALELCAASEPNTP